MRLSQTRFKAAASVGALLGVLFVSACTTTSCDKAQPVATAPSGTPMSTAESLADFDMAWQIINDTHFDTEFNGVDWAAMREHYRPQAQASTTRQETRRVIGAMLDTLGQSHFGIIPEEEPTPKSTSKAPKKKDTNGAPDSNTPSTDNEPETQTTDAILDGKGNADLGFEVQIIDHRAVVSAVRPGGPADAAGIRTGWILSKMRSESVDKRIERLAGAVGEDLVGIYGVNSIANKLQGPQGSTMNLTFLDAADTAHEYTLTREDMPGEAVVFGNLPPMQTSFDWGWFDSEQYGLGDKKIGYIDFSVWMMPIAVKFERAMVELKDADGIVIDLRGNPGGIGGMAAGLARYFITEKQSMGTMMMRGQDLTFNTTPIIVTRQGERLRPFTGPVAILLDQGSASTSEFFAGGMQAIGRVEIFGTRSAGMALAALMDRLPSGDVLLHAISDYVTSAGNTIEATGVIPEHPVPVTREDLLNGVDAPMHAAVDWIKSHD